jgi:RHS repeat-associated protein
MQVIREDGTVVNRYDYDAFGNAVAANTSEQVENRYRFQGREYDAHRGDYYFRNRTYIPEWGVFTGPDALVQIEANGPYLFANNNPLRFVDPEGLEIYHMVYGKRANVYWRFKVNDSTHYTMRLGTLDANKVILDEPFGQEWYGKRFRETVLGRSMPLQELRRLLDTENYIHRLGFPRIGSDASSIPVWRQEESFRRQLEDMVMLVMTGRGSSKTSYRFVVREAGHFFLVVPEWDKGEIVNWWRYDFKAWVPTPEFSNDATTPLAIANLVLSTVHGRSCVRKSERDPSTLGDHGDYIRRLSSRAFNSCSEDDAKLMEFLDQQVEGEIMIPYEAGYYNCYHWSMDMATRFNSAGRARMIRRPEAIKPKSYDPLERYKPTYCEILGGTVSPHYDQRGALLPYPRKVVH